MQQRWAGDIILDGSTLLTIDEVDEVPHETAVPEMLRPEPLAVSLADVLEETRDSRALTLMVRWIDGELRQRMVSVEDKVNFLCDRPVDPMVADRPFVRPRRRSRAFPDDGSETGRRRRRAVLHGPVPMRSCMSAPADQAPDADDVHVEEPKTGLGLSRAASSVSRTMAYLSSRSTDTLNNADCASQASSCRRPARFQSDSSAAHFRKTDTRSLEEPDSSTAAMLYNRIMPVIIMASVVLTVLQPAPMSGFAPSLVDLLLDAFFTSEVIVRWFASPRWLRFLCSGYNLIDLTSLLTLPLRLVLVRDMAAGGHVGMDGPDWFPSATVALECIAPVTRLLKLLRRFEKFHLLYHAFELAFEALPVLLYTGLLLLLSASGLIYLCETRDNIESVPRAMWLSVVTMSTVGYGDYAPKSTPGTFFTSLLIMCSALYMSIPLGIVGNAFHHVWEDRDRLLLMQRTKKRLAEWGYTPRDINTFFLLFSSDGNGTLDFGDFGRMIDEMKLGLGHDRSRELFEMFDHEGTGVITPEEFVANLFPNAVYAFLSEVNRPKDEPQAIGIGEDTERNSSCSGSSLR